jgi:hypothetical protein
MGLVRTFSAPYSLTIAFPGPAAQAVTVRAFSASMLSLKFEYMENLFSLNPKLLPQPYFQPIHLTFVRRMIVATEMD